MRLVTFQDAAGARIGAMLGDDQILDLPAAADVPSDMLGLIDAGPSALERAQAAVSAADKGKLIARSGVKLLAPIPRPRKNVFALGLNYADHVAEGARSRGEQVKLPEFPVYFTKAVTAVIGPDDAIPYDGRLSPQWDWEAELALVLGKTGRDIAKADALSYIFGYTCLNDVSVRDVQRRHGGQFFKGKSTDGTCPIGPWIVTADEIPNPGVLNIGTRVNGVTKQESNTRYMIFDVPTTIESLSAGLTLEAGDIVATGTPDGVGGTRTPPEWLVPGDIVEVEVQGIGVLRNTVVDRWA
jgi:2-keto-4-pentenoate hydratase/2-oxohepta-3-ene-1,7-dioic acid hydratase in catechol pathway